MVNKQELLAVLQNDLKSLAPGLATGPAFPDINSARWCISGKPGTGKSTLIHGNPQAFVLDLDRVQGQLAETRAIRYRVPDSVDPAKIAQGYRDAVSAIVARYRKGARDIRGIFADTLDDLVDVHIMEMCNEETKLLDPGDFGGGHGKGWSLIRHTIFRMFEMVGKSGMGWGVLCHVCEETKTVKGAQGYVERTYASLAVSPKMRTAARQKVDHMLMLCRGTLWHKGKEESIKLPGGKTIKRPGKGHTQDIVYALTSPGGVMDGDATEDVKRRLPFPDRITLPEIGGWDILTEEYDKAIELRKSMCR